MRFTKSPQHKINLYWIIILVLVLVLFGSPAGCINIAPSHESVIDLAAVNIPSEYGRVEKSWIPAGPIDRIVIVFGERHDLIKARENIARMLEYLQQKHQLSFIGLEATPFDKGELDTSSFRELPEFEDLKQLKKEIAWTLLDDGEINPYEYTGMTYGVDIYGVENWNLYRRDIKMSESIDWDEFPKEEIQLLSKVISMLLVGLQGRLKEEGHEDNLEKLNSCLEGMRTKKISFEAFLGCAAKLDKDGFAELKAIWDRFIANQNDAGEALYKYLKRKWIESGKDFPPDGMSNIAKYDQYLQLAEERGHAMANNLASLMRKPGVKVAALGIGAAHTEVLADLQQKHIPYIFVLPRGMAATATEWEEKTREWRLHGEPFSSDIGSLTEEWLPKDLMGQTRVGKKWFRTKVEILYTGIVAARLKQKGLPNREIEKIVNTAFSHYGRTATPLWGEIQEISGDLILPFKIDEKKAVLRITHDELDYTIKSTPPLDLAHGRITSRDFYQVIDYKVWQDPTERQKLIEQWRGQRADSHLLEQFRIIYTSLQKGKTPDEIEQIIKGNLPEGFTKVFDCSSLISTGDDIYGFYQDQSSGQRHFVRLTKDLYRAWEEPNNYIVEHGSVAGELRYEEIDLEPFVKELEGNIKDAALRDPLFLAKLDARLRSSTPTALLYSVKVDDQTVRLLIQGEKNNTKALRINDKVDNLFTKIWVNIMGKDPTFPTEQAFDKLSPEEITLLKEEVILPLVAHLPIDRSKSTGNRVVLNLQDEYQDFLALDLPDEPVLRTVIPYFLRDNRLVYIAKSSTARELKKAWQITIDPHKLKFFIARPSSAVTPFLKWEEKVAALTKKAEKIGIKVIDITDINPQKAEQLLQSALNEKDSLVFAFGHIPGSSKSLDLGGGKEFTQDEVPEFKKPTPRFLAFVGCKSYATGWPDKVISKNAGEVSFSFWEEFISDEMFEFLNEIVDEFSEAPGVHPSALRFLLDIVEKLHIPGGAVVELPGDLIKEG